ncbi:MAG: type II toxin-antitoxin system HigB family toxin [Chloroflexi bacterium]|nr:type II toxin-antitoxin system HigB family toxin [Chloroflexota bacterium]
MHIISKKVLREFWEVHPNAERPLRSWFTQVKKAQWHNFAELRQDFPSADLVGRLTVFNIGGNNYRLITRVEYRQKRVYVRSLLTHAEYDRGWWKDDDWYA